MAGIAADYPVVGTSRARFATIENDIGLTERDFTAQRFGCPRLLPGALRASSLCAERVGLAFEKACRPLPRNTRRSSKKQDSGYSAAPLSAWNEAVRILFAFRCLLRRG